MTEDYTLGLSYNHIKEAMSNVNLKNDRLTVLGQAANKLRDAILSGYFKPGQRLVEADLCELMQVSRTSMREALRRLEAERLITIIPNRGPSVALISWDEAEEIYAVRAMLEGEAVSLFACKATSSDIRGMRAALKAFVEADENEDVIGRLRSTSQFYGIILAGCGNGVIREILVGLVARINFLRARSMSRPGRARLSAMELRRILAGIEKKNPIVAREAAIAHVRSACAAARHVFEIKEAA